MKCMLSMSVFSHLRRLRIGEDSLKGDDIDGCFYILFYFYITSSMHSRPLVPRQTWRLTGYSHIVKSRSNKNRRRQLISKFQGELEYNKSLFISLLMNIDAVDALQ